MKKKSIMKVLVGTLCLSMLMSVTAFAAEDSANTAKDSQPAAVVEEAQQLSEYRTEAGVITSIEATKDGYRIQLGTDQTGVIFNTTEAIFVMDQKTGKVISVKDLKKDMELVAIMPMHTPMTMSIPGQISGATGFIVKDKDATVTVATFNDELVTSDNNLKLNISEKTQIIDTKGSKIAYKAEDLKGRDLVVLYSITTRSIPAQTSPEVVILLEKTDVKTDDKEVVPYEESTKEKASSYVELRTAAEAKGYKIAWTSNKKPIVLTKNDMTIELTIGSSDFTFTHMTKDLKALDRMEKFDMPVTLENGKTMVSSSFIDALE